MLLWKLPFEMEKPQPGAGVPFQAYVKAEPEESGYLSQQPLFHPATLEVRRRCRVNRDPGLLCVLRPVCGIGGLQGSLTGMGTVGTIALRVQPYVPRLVHGGVYSG